MASRSTRNVVIVEATPAEVYRAFLDPDLVAQWLVPDDMSARIHEFDAREGGTFRITLTYPQSQAGAGKTAADTNVYGGRFVELVPDTRIVEAIAFETEDSAMAGEMRMTVTLEGTRQGAYVTVVFDSIPAGIALAENEAGTASSLEKLAALISHGSC